MKKGHARIPVQGWGGALKTIKIWRLKLEARGWRLEAPSSQLSWLHSSIKGGTGHASVQKKHGGGYIYIYI